MRVSPEMESVITSVSGLHMVSPGTASLPPPPLMGSVTSNNRPVLVPPSSAYVKSLLPSHAHSDLHVSLSVVYHEHSSSLCSFPFKWCSGNFCMASIEHH